MAKHQEIDITVINKGDNAILVTDGSKKGWIPYSQIHPDDRDELTFYSSNGDEYTISVQVWFLEKDGWV